MTAVWLSTLLRAVAGVPGRLGTSHVRRAERLDLSAALLDAPAHRLADLGVDVTDVHEALRMRGKR